MLKFEKKIGIEYCHRLYNKYANLCTNIERDRIILTERVIDVSVGFVRGRSTVDLIVSQ